MIEETEKVCVSFRPARGLPRGELLWGRPVDAHPGGGTYLLQSSSFLVALAVNDLVRVQRDADGLLRVVDVVEPADSVYTAFVTDSRLLDAQRTSMTVRWRSAGAEWTEESAGALVTTWPARSAEQVLRMLQSDVEAGLGELMALVTRDHRRRDAQSEIEFRVQRTPSLV